MNLSFPSRFLNKLEIYQQIRNRQGISKYKRLWKYEKRYLQYAYEEGHQHLNSFINKEELIKWIKNRDCTYNGEKHEEIIGNLFYRRLIELQSNNNAKLIQKDDEAITNKDMSKDYEFRITERGLEIGEVLSEIYNRSSVLALLNRYKYSLIVDGLWLISLYAVIYIFIPQESIEDFQDKITSEINFSLFWLLTVLIIWPTLLYLFRLLYFGVESYYEK
ncbi:MAG: hypothetical protein UT11_C0033G0002 [Berkelbacteria bacterium GW2011_GWA2_38_9]|uniref:Uncharacterized protein n=1 Tax=Berkelbacteria bacterium GW2011_GWA2_38_9 TaxID=1618334 RepID=A0A0G0L8L7_9BACT|nr:MAG: hypothetical protein UT11_C0033G0002 [Berkelbacteria bacterium GW2011_GWA2_38_9]